MQVHLRKFQSFDILPKSIIHLDLRENFNFSLKNSLLYLLEACENALGEDNFRKLDAKINGLNCTEKFSSFLNAIHIKLYQTIKEKNLPDILKTWEKLLKNNFYKKNIDYINLTEIGSFYIDVVKQICSAEVVRENEYYSLNEQDFVRAKTQIQQGFDFLKEYFNDFYEEANNLVSEILILNAKGIQAGTSLDLFGMVHKNHTYKLEKITDVVDFIIHEQSHLYLHLIIKSDPLVLNPLERYESPLRKEPRPLIGIYHATFVLSRIVYVLRIALRQNLLPATEQEYCSDLIDHYTKRFDLGCHVLETYGQMTDFGTKVFIAMQNLIYPLKTFS